MFAVQPSPAEVISALPFLQLSLPLSPACCSLGLRSPFQLLCATRVLSFAEPKGDFGSAEKELHVRKKNKKKISPYRSDLREQLFEEKG